MFGVSYMFRVSDKFEFSPLLNTLVLNGLPPQLDQRDLADDATEHVNALGQFALRSCILLALLIIRTTFQGPLYC